jgi:hypothetical protein
VCFVCCGRNEAQPHVDLKRYIALVQQTPFAALIRRHRCASCEDGAEKRVLRGGRSTWLGRRSPHWRALLSTTSSLRLELAETSPIEAPEFLSGPDPPGRAQPYLEETTAVSWEGPNDPNGGGLALSRRLNARVQRHFSGAAQDREFRFGLNYGFSAQWETFEPGEEGEAPPNRLSLLLVYAAA